MKVLVTGAEGFIGKNLVITLQAQADFEIFAFDKGYDKSLLTKYTRDCDFVFHLAGVNRPQEEREFAEGNVGFTEELLGFLQKAGNTAPVLATSSAQAALDNPYGRSKKAGEDLLFSYAEKTGATVYVYRLPGVFGKWCRPNYNSVVATFCHNITHGLPLQINDPSTTLNLVYIDDVVREFLQALEGKPTKREEFCEIPTVHTQTLGNIAGLLEGFVESRSTLAVPNFADGFTKALYSTYLSYLPTDGFSYPLKMNVDERGSFTEMLRTPERGQVSVNIAKPGITKGNHWHHTKNEKFLVVSGQGVIRFRKIDEETVIEYAVSGDKLEVVDIPVGYTHNIENTGTSDMVTLMWANGAFDPQNSDTFFLPV